MSAPRQSCIACPVHTRVRSRSGPPSAPSRSQGRKRTEAPLRTSGTTSAATSSASHPASDVVWGYDSRPSGTRASPSADRGGRAQHDGGFGSPALLELPRQLPPAWLVLGAEFKPAVAAVPFKHGGRGLDARRAEQCEGHVAARTIADGQVEAISTVRPRPERNTRRLRSSAQGAERGIIRNSPHSKSGEVVQLESAVCQVRYAVEGEEWLIILFPFVCGQVAFPIRLS